MSESYTIAAPADNTQTSPATALSSPYLASVFERLIPIDADRWEPLIKFSRHGVTSLEQALAWSERWPRLVWAVRTGFKRCYSDGRRLAVIDIDVPGLVESRGLLPRRLLRSPWQVKTPAGRHIYVEDCREVQRGRRWDDPQRHERVVDLITSPNGYVIAPGAMRPDGQLYFPSASFGMDERDLPRLRDQDLKALDIACPRNGRRKTFRPAPGPTGGPPPGLKPPAPAGGPPTSGSELRRKWVGDRNVEPGNKSFAWQSAGPGQRRDVLNKTLLQTLLMPRNRQRTVEETREWAFYIESSFKPPRYEGRLSGDSKSQVEADIEAAYAYARELIESGQAATGFSEIQRRRRTGAPQEDLQGEVLALLDQGMTQTAVAAQLGISRGRVWRLAAGVDARRSRVYREAVLEHQVSALLDERVSDREIARILGISRQKVARIAR